MIFVLILTKCWKLEVVVYEQFLNSRECDNTIVLQLIVMLCVLKKKDNMEAATCGVEILETDSKCKVIYTTDKKEKQPKNKTRSTFQTLP